jgi:Rps23 Pro-64 3,4-dihydroxylase Tpa1-like proline 4-hydroxylase
MSGDLTREFRQLMAGKIELPVSIEELRSRYRNAKPFPHVVIDNMFLEADLEALRTEMSQLRSEQWLDVDQDSRERTARMRSAAEMGIAGDRLLSIVHSAAFLYLLSELTAISQLLPDPYLQGAGYALMRRGDYFNVHADRNVAYETGLVRRLAMIVYLNKSWKPEYHGELELWTPDGRTCDATVQPLFNKTVIFEVAYPNFHGVPTPLACPPDRMRQSFITYYHTAGNGNEPAIKPHTSRFAPRFYGSNRVTLQSLVRDMIPPLLLRMIRRLRRSE